MPRYRTKIHIFSLDGGPMIPPGTECELASEAEISKFWDGVSLRMKNQFRKTLIAVILNGQARLFHNSQLEKIED